MIVPRGRRLFRALKNLVADRDAPPVDALLRETDPDAFLWRALPHAARTFSLAIALLKEPLGSSVGTAYLFCRALDTAEDLATDPVAREASLRAVERLATGERVDVPIPESIVQDVRDLGHLAVLRRSDLLAALRERMAPSSRPRLAALVSEMAAGMLAASREKDASGGLLSTASRPAYCDAVLGAPLRFAESEHRASIGVDPTLPEERVALSKAAGEVVQLANICRDIEKDLARGVAYDDILGPYLARREAPTEVVASVRRGLTLRVAELGPSIVRYFGGMEFGDGFSGERGGAAVMLVATCGFWRKTSRRLAPSPLVEIPVPGKFGVLVEAARAMRSRAAWDRTVAVYGRGFQVARP